jgi:uncharacterized protein YerC
MKLSELEDRDKILWEKKLEYTTRLARAIQSVKNGMTYRRAEKTYGIPANTISNNCRKHNVTSRRRGPNGNRVRHTIVKAMIESGASIEEMFETVAATEDKALRYTAFYAWLCNNNYITTIRSRK